MKADAERPASSSFFSSFLQNLLAVGLYKRNQGRITRQVTFFAIALTVTLGAWRMNALASLDSGLLWRWGLPGLVALIGAWFAYRLVNMPNFADFLIAVEAEMSKVSWPTQTELFRGSLVVLFTIIFLAAVLWLFDFVWTFVFTQLVGILG